MHFCKICCTSFSRKQTYDKHLLSKKHKKRESNSELYTCKCGKSYSCRETFQRHKTKCSENPNEKVLKYYEEKLESSEKERLAAEMEKEALRKRVEELLLSQSQTCIGTQHNTQNIETQNNITININAFGKENTDYLDDKEILACIDRVYKSIPALIEKIHFDPDHPENHNIKITNKKLPYATVMGDNSKWKTVDRKDAIESLVFNGYNILDEKYPDTKNQLTSRKRNHFEGFQDKFQSEDKELMKQLKTDVELAVLNGHAQ